MSTFLYCLAHKTNLDVANIRLVSVRWNPCTMYMDLLVTKCSWVRKERHSMSRFRFSFVIYPRFLDLLLSIDAYSRRKSVWLFTFYYVLFLIYPFWLISGEWEQLRSDIHEWCLIRRFPSRYAEGVILHHPRVHSTFGSGHEWSYVRELALIFTLYV